MENMEKTKTVLKSSTRVLIIGIIILVLIFLSFLMVSIVPRVLSSLANSTVSITSAFFPASKTNTTATTTGTTTNSGVTLSNTSSGNNSTTSNSSAGDYLSNFFGPRKTNATPQPTYTIATSTNKNSNNSSNNTSNNTTSQNNNSNRNNANYQRASYGLPDLAVTITSIGTSATNGVFVTSNNFTTTDTVVVKFRIENQGTAPSGAWNMRVTMPSSNVNDQIKVISAGSMPAGAAITGQAVFNTPAVGSNQQVTISIDPNGAVSESNKVNNVAAISLNVTPVAINYNNNNGYNNNNNYNNNYNYNNNGNYNNNYNICVNGYLNGVYTGCTDNSYRCVTGYTNGIYNNCNNGNSIPNLTAGFIALGTMNTYNQFIQTTYFRTTDTVAVKFQVTNNSSVSTAAWTWKAQLAGPNSYYNTYNNSYTSGYTYNSDGSRTYTPVSSESGLAPGETRTYTASFPGLTYGTNNVTVTVDSANNILESNEGDNTISQTFFANY